MPRTSPLILFGRNALTIRDDMAVINVVQGEKQPFSNIEDWATEVAQSRYITFEHNMWLLDGNYKFMGTVPHVGYMSANISGSNSNFAIPVPEIQVIFGNVYSTNGLTLYFSEHTEDWADSIVIGFYNSSNALIRSDTYTPTSATFQTNQAVSDFKRIDIFINSTNKPYRFARLLGIDFDTITRFQNSDIKEARVVEEISPLSAELPVNTLDLRLYSSNGDFSIVEPAGFYSVLKDRDPIEVYEKIGCEAIFIGKFYLEKWESKSANEATFQAYDAIGLLEKTSSLGLMGGDAGLVLTNEFIGELLANANIEYEIDPFWITYGTDGHVPQGTAREVLHQLLFQLYTTKTAAVAKTARSKKIEIIRLPLARDITEYDHVITKADHANAELTLKPLVTDVQVIGYSKMTEPDTITAFSGSLSAGEHIIIFQSPMDNLSITGGTIISERTNYAVINVPTPSLVVITGNKWFFPTTSLTKHNVDTPTVAPRNIVKADGSLVAYPTSTMSAKADLLLSYFQQRYLLKAKFFAHRASVGESVLVDVQSERKFAGIIEKMTTDLANGFVSDAEITGIILPTNYPDYLRAGKYNDNHPKLFYSGTWSTASHLDAYGGDLRYVNVGHSGQVNFSFFGKQFKLFYTEMADRGSVQIYIDGVLSATLNQAGSPQVFQKVWDSGVLSGIHHTVSIVKLGTSNIVDLDAIEVL